MNLLLIIFYIVLFVGIAYVINKKKIPELPVYTLPILFLIKIGYAGLFYYVYTYVYGNGAIVEDAYYFFHDSQHIYNLFHESKETFFTIFLGLNNDVEYLNQFIEETTKWISTENKTFNDTRNIIRVNVLLHFISNHQILIHFIILTFISLLGIVDVFQWVKRKAKISPFILIGLLTLIPSIAFWSSNNLKEPLLFFAFAILLRGIFDELSVKQRVWRIVLGVILALAFKPYVLASLIVAVIFYFTFSKFTKYQSINAVAYLTFGIVFVYISGLHTPITNIISDKQFDFLNVSKGGLYVIPNQDEFYYIELDNVKHFEIDSVKQIATLTNPTDAFYMDQNSNYKRYPFYLDSVNASYPIYLNLSGAKSIVKVTVIQYSYLQLLKNIPEALNNCFVEPLPSKGSSKLMLLSFLENLFYLLLILLSIVFPRSLSVKEKRMIFSLIVSGLLLTVLIGWTTPVAGAIVRYMLPVHFIIVIIFGLTFKGNFKRKPTLISDQIPVKK